MKSSKAFNVNDLWVTEGDRIRAAEWPKGEAQIEMVMDLESVKLLADGKVSDRLQHRARSLVGWTEPEGIDA